MPDLIKAGIAPKKPVTTSVPIIPRTIIPTASRTSASPTQESFETRPTASIGDQKLAALAAARDSLAATTQAGIDWEARIAADIAAHPEQQTAQGAIDIFLTPAQVVAYQNAFPNGVILPDVNPKPWNEPPDRSEESTYVPQVPGESYYQQTTPTAESLALEQPKLAPITWSNQYQVEGAPSWWMGMIPSRNDPQTEYATMLNGMIPYMSPEDQRYTASLLYRLYPDVFITYNPEIQGMPGIPTEITSDMRRWATSADRAEQILGTLDKIKSVSGSSAAFGPGYEYLRQLGSLLRDMGNRAGNGQTRTQYEQFAAAYDPLAAETKQENLSAYSELTRMLAQPYYTAGQVHPTTTLETGQVIPGAANRSWF